MTTPRVSEQVEWLSLIDISGPFLAPSVLEEAFPQGLEKVETPRRQRIRSAYEEWRDALDDDDPQLPEMHAAWTLMVLQDMLEYDDRVLIRRKMLQDQCAYSAPEHGVRIAPDYAVRSEDGGYRLLVAVWPPETDLERPVSADRWPASPLERMTLLCRANGVRLGLITNGERWMLVNAPVGGTSGYAAWLSRLWWQEPITLKAFQSLLGVRRCFGPREETLDSLLEKSLEFQEEVTDTLGEQVRRAVEILIQSLGRADQDRNGELLKEVRPVELYEAGLTVMMRLVFTLCAEERGLLLLGDPIYDQHYALSTLRARLREDADRFGVEVLERRHDAWSRLLAVFRAIYGGIEHESLRMPAMGGSLFDPDRFPLLEGRAKGTNWRETPAAPLPIDNRTVLLLLDALQVLEQRGGAQLLSYRALDVEQVGHVYEGLLEYTVAKLDGIAIGLIGSQKARHPSIPLADLEGLHSRGAEAATEHLAEISGRSIAAIRRALERGNGEGPSLALVHACGGDESLARRLFPFAGLIRADSWGALVVYRPGSFAIVHGSDRRDTGTHYTPRALTEAIVEETLQPLVYDGPAAGRARDEWKLKSPDQLLDIKVCDPAMGSGAFLVQVCRYLGQMLVEAWSVEESNGKAVTADGAVLDDLAGRDPLPASADERLILARRLIAERCIYGVDGNPMAVELAKLSIWLVTMAKGRPFGFLDHNLRCGDSMLGIHPLNRLTELHMDPAAAASQPRLFGRNIEKAVAEALEIRNRLRSVPIRDIRDVEKMSRLDQEARKRMHSVQFIADAMVGEALRTNADMRLLNPAMDALSVDAGEVLNESKEAERILARRAAEGLSTDLPAGKPPRRPFHWPLVFPEVFSRTEGGFDAIVGNPPFLGGQRITGVLGTAYRNWLVNIIAGGRRGSVDLVGYFFLRVYSLTRNGGDFGLLAVSTIAEGDTKQVGLGTMVEDGAVIRAAWPNEPWPGAAAVVTSRVHVHKGDWRGSCKLHGRQVERISPSLSDQEQWNPNPLKSNAGRAFQGSIVLGRGFVLSPEDAQRMLDADPRNADVIFPYLNGEDLNSDPDQRASRCAINFWDWPEERAKTYPLPYKWIRQHVHPERMRNSDRNAREKWWLYLRARSELYHAIGCGNRFEKHPEGWKAAHSIRLGRVIAIVRHSKTVAFALLPPNQIFSDALNVFATDQKSLLAVLQSAIHVGFAWQYGGKLKTDLRYGPSECFETFPLPSPDKLGDGSELARLGEKLDGLRGEIMKVDRIGLTELFGRMNDSTNTSRAILKLRDLHVAIDRAAISAYEWDDVALGHAFHPVPYLPEDDRVRFTISEAARLEVLKRLSKLNRERCEKEAEQASRPSAASQNPATRRRQRAAL